MSPRLRRSLALAGVLALGLAPGCGKRADPEPPESAVPEPIDDLSGVASEGAILLSWSAPGKNLDGSSPPELVGFQVLHSYRPFGITDASPTTPELRFVLPIPLDADDEPIIAETFSVIDREPVEGAYNTYRVVSYSSSALESAGSNLVVVAWVAPPGMPGKPRAIPEEGRVYLEWTAAAPPQVASTTVPPPTPTYRVYRALGEGPFELMTPEPLTGRTWTDPSPPKGEPVRYAVRAVVPAAEAWVEGPTSEAVEIVAEDLSPPPVPQSLVGTRGVRGVELRWDPVEAADLAGYHVYRSVDGGPARRLTSAPILRTGFRDEAAPRGALRYHVTSVDRSERANESAPSISIRVN